MQALDSGSRHPLSLLLAAAAAFTGSGALLKLGGAAAGATPGAGLPALGLVTLVILLGLSGVVLAAMAVKELVDLRRLTRHR